MVVFMDKKEIRIKHLRLLKNIDEDKRKVYDQEIFDKLISSSEWNNAEQIGITISEFPELNTHKIMNQAFFDNKLIFVPKIYPRHQMKFINVNEKTTFVKNKFGLIEPNISNFTLHNNVNLDLMIVPGLAFDLNKNRIGFGGGYYDRYLEQHNLIKTVSLAYEEMILPKFSWKVENTDIKIDKVITNDGVIN